MAKLVISIGLFLLIGLSIFLFGCTNAGIPNDQPIQDTISPSDQQPVTPLVDEVTVTSKDTNSIVEANNKFAFDLYSKYQTEDGNIFISPYSVSTALAMTYEGAKGQTAKEMQTVLYLPENAELRRDAISQIYKGINKEDKTYQLSTANALWAQDSFKFQKDYFDIVQKYYGGSATNLDFIGDTENSRLIINEWVEERTNDKIKDLIPSGALTAETRLVLTNAIYFKGEWANQFNKDDTKEQDFRVSPNKNVKTPMMQRTDDESKFNYAGTNDLQILELPYSGEDLSMLIILPKKEDLEDLENSFTLEQLSKWKEMLNEQRVNIYIPKFKFETKYFMEEILPDMGMPTAFSDSANFTGMEDDPRKDLKIDKVIHQAFVEVNEEGTEAAAATAVTMIEITSVGPEPRIPTFRADHPFIFIIQQKDTGNILFLGRVNDPAT